MGEARNAFGLTLGDWILAFLAHNGGEVRGKTRIHKALFLVKQEVREDLVQARFVPSRLGPWSMDVERALKRLVDEGLVEKRVEDGTEVYRLTREGTERARKILSVLREAPHWSDINEIFKMAGRAPLWALLGYIYTFYPQWAINSEKREEVMERVRREGGILHLIHRLLGR